MRRAFAVLVLAALIPSAAAVIRTRRRGEVWHTLAQRTGVPDDSTRGP